MVLLISKILGYLCIVGLTKIVYYYLLTSSWVNELKDWNYESGIWNHEL